MTNSRSEQRPLRVYLASRYGRRAELQKYADQLRIAGHDVTSEWINGSHSIEGDLDAPHLDKQRFAIEDLAGVTAADIVISFTEPAEPVVGRARGGRHVEFGIGLALGKRMIVVGHRENVFHSLPGVVFYSSWRECLAFLYLDIVGFVPLELCLGAQHG